MSDIQTQKVMRLQNDIKYYYKMLDNFPTSSPLGRESIKAIIRHKEKKLNKLLSKYEEV